MTSKTYTAQEMREAAILAEIVEVPNEFCRHKMERRKERSDDNA